MRPKARGLGQHSGPPGWLEESDQADVILNVMDGPYRLSFSYRTGCSGRSCPAAVMSIRHSTPRGHYKSKVHRQLYIQEPTGGFRAHTTPLVLLSNITALLSPHPPPPHPELIKNQQETVRFIRNAMVHKTCKRLQTFNMFAGGEMR
jgi:hypothetical protein